MSIDQGKLRILCVEDDFDTFRLVANILPDYEVLPATGIDEGLKQCALYNFSLVFVDQQLADGRGKEFCKKLREKDPHIPVVFISGDPNLTDSAVRDAGGQRIIRKATITFVHDLYVAALELARDVN